MDRDQNADPVQPLTREIRTSWGRLAGAAALFLGAAILFVVVGAPGGQPATDRLFSRPIDLVVAGLLGIEAARLILLGLTRPRLTLGPRGLTDHSGGRGLMLWSDFHDVKLLKGTFGRWRPPTIKLISSAAVCWHYNQRIPAWRRFSHARLFRRRSIPIRVVGIDHDVEWLDAEIARRVDQRAPL